MHPGWIDAPITVPRRPAMHPSGFTGSRRRFFRAIDASSADPRRPGWIGAGFFPPGGARRGTAVHPLGRRATRRDAHHDDHNGSTKRIEARAGAWVRTRLSMSLDRCWVALSDGKSRNFPRAPAVGGWPSRGGVRCARAVAPVTRCVAGSRPSVWVARVVPSGEVRPLVGPCRIERNRNKRGLLRGGTRANHCWQC